MGTAEPLGLDLPVVQLARGFVAGLFALCVFQEFTCITQKAGAATGQGVLALDTALPSAQCLVGEDVKTVRTEQETSGGQRLDGTGGTKRLALLGLGQPCASLGQGKERSPGVGSHWVCRESKICAVFLIPDLGRH